MARRDAREAARGQPASARVIGMHLDERLRAMQREARALSAARHRVPLVAHAAGVEAERKIVRRRVPQGRCVRRHEARLAVGREEAAVREEAALPALAVHAQRPLHGLERFEFRV